mmetsp:Transcript_11211/g.33638  ORF Transcript_11211/g.33638 Transcript_11211/m.33638 type:complete len:84 (+) Transcript_11211:1734-1985(+)
MAAGAADTVAVVTAAREATKGATTGATAAAGVAGAGAWAVRAEAPPPSRRIKAPASPLAPSLAASDCPFEQQEAEIVSSAMAF